MLACRVGKANTGSQEITLLTYNFTSVLLNAHTLLRLVLYLANGLRTMIGI